MRNNMGRKGKKGWKTGRKVGREWRKRNGLDNGKEDEGVTVCVMQWERVKIRRKARTAEEERRERVGEQV